MARWRGDPERLKVDLRRAIEALHWAVVSLDRRPAALELDDLRQPPIEDVLGAVAWRLVALLPDGRSAHVVAWTPRIQHVAVAVRVGYFGDEAKERRFIAQLRRTLAGSPHRVRHDTFVLPP